MALNLDLNLDFGLYSNLECPRFGIEFNGFVTYEFTSTDYLAIAGVREKVGAQSEATIILISSCYTTGMRRINYDRSCRGIKLSREQAIEVNYYQRESYGVNLWREQVEYRLHLQVRQYLQYLGLRVLHVVYVL